MTLFNNFCPFRRANNRNVRKTLCKNTVGDHTCNIVDGEELIEAIKDAHFVGIRSRTHLTKEILEHAQKLVAVGCYV